MKLNKESKSIKVVIGIYKTANNKQNIKGHIVLSNCVDKKGKPMHTTFNSSLIVGDKIVELINKCYKKEYHDEVKFWYNYVKR